MSKQITIPVPDGKRAEWVNGVLTLVDEKPQEDNRPVIERVKTFSDACKELGYDHPLVNQHTQMLQTTLMSVGWDNTYADIIAYLRLRIITAALNEGWTPLFTTDEYRYFPWFYLYTKEEYDQMSDKEKESCVLRSSVSPYDSSGFMYVSAHIDSSVSYAGFGSRLAFKTHELAVYAGRQFTDEWADFMFKARNSEELNEKSGNINLKYDDNE